MIHKWRMHRRKRHARHVAGDAIFPRDWAGFAGMIWRDFRGWRRNMTGETLLVVSSCCMDKLFVWVMASGTGESCVAIAPAAAALEAIRLEADVRDAGDTHLVNVVERAMASAAKIDESDRAQFAGIKDSLAARFVLLCVHELRVSATGAVACFACYAGRQV